MPLLLPLMLAGALAAAPEYVGDEVCRRCHAAQYTSFRQTGMARSAAKPNLQDPLGEFANPARVSGKSEGQAYRSFIRDGKAYHSSEAGETHELFYAIGSGDHGRSYVITRGESLFLSPLSYYSSIRKWDLSPGYAAGLARDFTRPVTAACLGCHSSLPRALSIGCERCHGPGAVHASKGAPGIINPAKLSPQLRDDVCNQCHLSGDIRVLKAGKAEADFRPGMRLDEVVSIFSIPAALRRGGSEVLGQTAQLKMSRCWIASGGKMGCISCHDPHRQPRGPEAASLFRERCLKCHTVQSCASPAAARQATAPSDNCVSCHMPPSPLAGVAHTAHTDHRIRKDPDIDDLFPPASRRVELVSETGVPDGRALALAYAEAAKGLPRFIDQSRSLLSEAARQAPNDSEIQTALGLSLSAREPLERSISLGSKSPEVRRTLATILTGQGDLTTAAKLLEEAIRLAPYDAPIFVELAKIYARQGRDTERRDILNRLRAFDPANPDLP